MPRPSADQLSYLFGNQNVTINAWNPFEVAARWNSQAFAAYSTIGSEMQDFAARRIKEDFALVQRVSQCRAPHDLMGAYTDFWLKAVEDYGKEAAIVNKLMINASSKMVVVAKAAMEKEKTRPIPVREAAE